MNHKSLIFVYIEFLGIAASNAPSVTANADSNVGNAGRGLFDFNINLYTDETMTTEMILNPSIAVGQRLNFGVEAGKYKNFHNSCVIINDS